MTLQTDDYCFACGKDNPIGLKLKFDFSGGKNTVRFIPGKEHQGWSDIVHGGILSTLMDEAMAWLVIHRIGFAVTSSMEARFLRPAMVGDELTVVAEIGKEDGRKVHARCRITGSAGKTVAAGKGIFVLQGDGKAI